VSLVVEGGAGADQLAWSGVDGALMGKVVFQGGAGSDAITGPPTDTEWHVTGVDAGHVAGLSFQEVENLLGAAGNQDVFIVQGTAYLTGVMDGGAGGFDSMVLRDGTFQQVDYFATGPHSGTITRDGNVISYDGLEPITDNTATANKTFATSDWPDTATLTDNGDGTVTLASLPYPLPAILPGGITIPVSTFEGITFVKPTASLTINLGSSALDGQPGGTEVPLASRDRLTVNNLNLATANLILDGQLGADTIRIAGIVTAGNVTILADRIEIPGTLNVISLTATAADGGAAAGDGTITGGVIYAAPEAVIDLTGGTVTATGAVSLQATATANIFQSQFTINVIEGSIAVVDPTARVLLAGSNVTATTIDADAIVNVVVNTAAAPGSAADAGQDAAITVVTVLGRSEMLVQGASVLSATGAVTLDATTNLNITSLADGDAGANNAKGASFASTTVTSETTAEIADTVATMMVSRRSSRALVADRRICSMCSLIDESFSMKVSLAAT
jgi:hypothetical protein